MRKSILIFLVGFASTSVNQSAQAQEASVAENTNTNQVTESNGWSASVGLGVSSLKLDYEGSTKSAEGVLLLRIDKADASSNYALQYSSYGQLLNPLDIFDDFFDCLFSFGDECDELGNTTTVED